MLQSATLAESLGAPRSVVAAALLHDIGYFLDSDGEVSAGEGCNFGHETLGAKWLARAFGEDVTAPIALHVDAKRYLCAVETGYFEQLSAMSRRTLITQGGVMNELEAAAFEKLPAFDAALFLRRCDDRGKEVSMQTESIELFRALLTATLRAPD